MIHRAEIRFTWPDCPGQRPNSLFVDVQICPLLVKVGIVLSKLEELPVRCEAFSVLLRSKRAAAAQTKELHVQR